MKIPMNEIHSISIPEEANPGMVEVRMHNVINKEGVPTTTDEIYQSIMVDPRFSIYILEDENGPYLLIEI